MAMKKQPNSRLCLLCGVQNRIGLNLAFWQDGERVMTRAVLPETYQSYPGVAHGGIVTALLDETMGRAIIGLHGTFAFTAKMEVKFHRPAPLETALVASGWITQNRRRLFMAAGQLVDEATGALIATAEGTFVRLPDEEVREMADQLDFWEVVEDAPSHTPPDPNALSGARAE